MAKTKKKPAAEEEEILDLPDDDEEIVSLESIKKRFLKKCKELDEMFKSHNPFI